MQLSYGFQPLDGEVFKNVTIEGYENKYKVSNFGRVLSLESRSKELYTTYGYSDTRGYMTVRLRNGKVLKKCIRVHTLVALAFLPEREVTGRKEVNHKDGNKHNNRLDNLEWVSSLENTQHAVRTGLMDTKGSKHINAKLTDAQVLEIRKLYHTTIHKDIAIQFGICSRQVGDIINGVNWSHLPLEDYSQREKPKVRRNERMPVKLIR